MIKQTRLIILLLGIGILVVLGYAVFSYISRPNSVMIVNNQNTPVVSVDIPAQGDAICPTAPLVKEYGPVSVNNQKSVTEYWVPVSCAKDGGYLVFTRQKSDTSGGDWEGTFDVSYHTKDLPPKFLFVHKGLLIDIAGGGVWQVTQDRDVIHLSLGFGDMGVSASWHYYISQTDQKLLLSVINNSIESDAKSFAITLNTKPVHCSSVDKGSDPQIATAILVNGLRAKALPQAISSPCEGNELNISPVIHFIKADVQRQVVTFEIPDNGTIDFNYNTGLFGDKFVAGSETIKPVSLTDNPRQCTVDADCVAIPNPSNGCYFGYFNISATRSISEFKNNPQIMVQDCPRFGQVYCDINKKVCSADRLQ